jgi:hypothetical protein
MKWSDLRPSDHRIPDDPELRAEMAEAIDSAATRTPRDLSDDEVRKVRTLRAQGIHRMAVAKQLGIKRGHASAIVGRSTHKSVKSLGELETDQ